MKHAEVSKAWRPVRAGRGAEHSRHGVLSAFAFNLCLLLLPLAVAAAVIVIARDHLYGYQYSDAAARVIASRVAKLNGELIQIDFDRQNQWSDLVDLELRSNDLNAARGFLLSGAGMLPRRAAEILNQSDATDAELEVAALQLLQPSTRARYVASGPLLSDRRRDARPLPSADPIGAPDDFELLARAVLAEPETDPLQFVLTGYSLGLAGDLSPRMARGAAALLEASRRDDYPPTLGGEIAALFTASMPIEAFRAAASQRAQGEAAGAFANASAAFRASLSANNATQVRQLLDQIGAISEATSRSGAAALLTHASSLRDLPRLSLIAQAAGDRAVAAAKRLPRDGRLLGAARGQLTMTQELMAALIVAAAAALGLVLLVIMKLIETGLSMWRRWEADAEYAGELVEIGGNNWRPL
jgi:hypothetical protein